MVACPVEPLGKCGVTQMRYSGADVLNTPSVIVPPGADHLTDRLEEWITSRLRSSEDVVTRMLQLPIPI